MGAHSYGAVAFPATHEKGRLEITRRPRSETVTGRGPARTIQAERGDTPDQLNRSHLQRIIQRRIVSSGYAGKARSNPLAGQFENVVDWRLSNWNDFFFANPAPRLGGPHGRCQLFVFEILSWVSWNSLGSGFFDKSMLKSDTRVS